LQLPRPAAGASEARTGIALNHKLLVSEVAVTLQEQIDAAVEAWAFADRA
jgi:hypothetical protein